MKPASIVCLLSLLFSCTSIPDGASDTKVNDDIEWFVAAVLERRANTVLRHFKNTGIANPISESVKLFQRDEEFYEVWNNIANLEANIYEDEGEIFSESELPSGKVLKMIWINDTWNYHSFGIQE